MELLARPNKGADAWKKGFLLSQELKKLGYQFYHVSFSDNYTTATFTDERGDSVTYKLKRWPFSRRLMVYKQHEVRFGIVSVPWNEIVEPDQFNQRPDA